MNKGANIYKLLSTSFQGVKRLFVLAYVIAANAENNEAGIKNNKKSFLQRGKIKDYNVLIDGRNFYDHSVNDLIKQYDDNKQQDKAMMILPGVYYTNFKDNYRLMAVDLSKQKL